MNKKIGSASQTVLFLLFSIFSTESARRLTVLGSTFFTYFMTFLIEIFLFYAPLLMPWKIFNKYFCFKLSFLKCLLLHIM